jgi:hypothetical protein
VSHLYFSAAYLTHDLYLFTTHITRNKIIAGVVLVIVAVAAVVFWVVRRRQSPPMNG